MRNKESLQHIDVTDPAFQKELKTGKFTILVCGAFFFGSFISVTLQRLNRLIDFTISSLNFSVKF